MAATTPSKGKSKSGNKGTNPPPKPTTRQPEKGIPGERAGER